MQKGLKVGKDCRGDGRWKIDSRMKEGRYRRRRWNVKEMKEEDNEEGKEDEKKGKEEDAEGVKEDGAEGNEDRS